MKWVLRRSTEYDLLGRPTNAADSVSTAREWLYNRRSELAAANVGTNVYGYAYDSIGNRLRSSENATTNSYAANCLNQYSSAGRDVPAAPRTPIRYDADGNMTDDGEFAYSYDAENRLISIYPISPAVGSLAVENRYDHRHRRVRKVVKKFDGAAWETAETHTFVWDGGDIVLEKVEFADGTTRTYEYFWGADRSGAEQGAGGVGGLHRELHRIEMKAMYKTFRIVACVGFVLTAVAARGFDKAVNLMSPIAADGIHGFRFGQTAETMLGKPLFPALDSSFRHCPNDSPICPLIGSVGWKTISGYPERLADRLHDVPCQHGRYGVSERLVLRPLRADEAV